MIHLQKDSIGVWMDGWIEWMLGWMDGWMVGCWYVVVHGDVMELFQYVEDPVAEVESTEANGEYQAGILVDNVDVLDLRYGRPNCRGALLDGVHHAWSR